jgi:hypothetical protein
MENIFMEHENCEFCYFGIVQDGGFWGKRVMCRFTPEAVTKEVDDWCGSFLLDDTKVDPEDFKQDDVFTAFFKS